MHQKQNLIKKKKIKEGSHIPTLTTDVSNILKAINTNNAVWKNNSLKLNKTITSTKNTTHNKNIKKNIMTQQDIDKLFNRTKSKNKTQDNLQNVFMSKPIKDFANSVKFLKVQDQFDKLLNGLPTQDDMTQQKINNLFTQDNIFQSDLTTQFKKNYTVGKIVGEGAYACVRIATFKPQNKKVAIKVYQKSKIKQPQRKKSVRREIKILQNLNHPNVVKIYDVVQTNNHLNIVMQYLDGISLNIYLKNQPNQKALQKNCKHMIRCLTQALQYLHERQISHRDIKLQNVILNNNDLTPKLIDFGFSTCIQKNKKVKIFCGTPSYMAPQIVQKKQYRGQPADIWALGVLAFVTLTGIFPFKGATDQQLYKKINSADYPKHQLYFSKQISDLIGKMLKINPQQRITATQILSHPWLNKHDHDIFVKKQKKNTQISECRKRTTISSHKSRQKQQTNLNVTGNIRKLTQTCHENLKLQLKMIKQSPNKLNNTYTQRKIFKEITNKNVTKLKKQGEKQTKINTKVFDLLKMGIKKIEDKSKSKTRRI